MGGPAGILGAFVRAWRKPGGLARDVAPALIYGAILFWAGLIPLKSLPGPDFKLLDKSWHLVAFAGLSVLLSRVFLHWGRGATAARDAALSATLLGALLEILQSFTTYRSADWADLLADALGAALAYAVLTALSRWA